MAINRDPPLSCSYLTEGQQKHATAKTTAININPPPSSMSRRGWQLLLVDGGGSRCGEREQVAREWVWPEVVDLAGDGGGHHEWAESQTRVGRSGPKPKRLEQQAANRGRRVALQLASSAQENSSISHRIAANRRQFPESSGDSKGMEATSNLPLPDAFLQFLNENEIDPSIYSAGDLLPRYVRLKPGCEEQVEAIEADIGCKLVKLEWLPNFYSLPPHIQIAGSKSYQEGKIYGIDAASGAAVSALNISPGDHVLDLCAAPGAKICMVLELLGNSGGSVTGVDVARHRLAACRTLVQKYSLGDHCRLFVADGAEFSLMPIRVHSGLKSCIVVSLSCLQISNLVVIYVFKIVLFVVNREFGMNGDELLYKEWTSRKPWKERKKAIKEREKGSLQLNQDPDLIYYGRHSGVVGLSKTELFKTVSNNDISQYGYDKVLVDAECTHDGSIKHIQKFENWGWTTLERRVLDAERTDDLAVLQFQLLTNGFKLLKVGGYLVYSTCSLTYAQNEDVVQKFLSLNPCAELMEIDGSKCWPCKSGRIPKTLRFDPLTSSTSGLFVAKFTKQPEP
ncbi:hypothetical protein SSX86_014734 [Deinandra increscens subsp. villosa]|uniref:SAM-dependent MTase RsmB/NOP-type domain-containing protein n=1 Tax=Deinandra increscens subsp. villosa TaxID=3103831 RepID=A0AAP0D2F5_9ASTR